MPGHQRQTASTLQQKSESSSWPPLDARTGFVKGKCDVRINCIMSLGRPQRRYLASRGGLLRQNLHLSHVRQAFKTLRGSDGRISRSEVLGPCSFPKTVFGAFSLCKFLYAVGQYYHEPRTWRVQELIRGQPGAFAPIAFKLPAQAPRKALPFIFVLSTKHA